ncbi:MAG: TolC family protein [Acidobacteriota bacterium]|nr:TolC family protein [Acidobacteriota bacterium]
MRLSFLLPIVISGSCFAQSIDLPGADPFFPRPSYFRKHFQTAPSRIELQPPVRLADFVVENKLELSLKNFLELTVANNPDVVSQKVTVEFSRNAITRAFGAFDPTAFARFNSTRTSTASSSLLVGAATLNQLQQPLSLQVAQTMQTGTQYVVAFNGTKTSSNSSFSTFNPQLNANINFSMVQPLLRGRGTYITRLPISIARSKLRVAGYTFEDQLIQLVAFAENAYWDVVGARENLRVQEENLKLADAALKRAQKELELGATSPLEIFQPQANYANAELSVSQGRFRLAQAEDALRRQMGADLDPNIRNLPIVLTETILPPAEVRVDREAAVETALRQRPDVKAVLQSLDVDDLGIKQANNLLLPDLSLTAQYGSSGLGGIFFPRTNLTDPSLPVIPIVGGIRDALGGVFGFGFPVYGFGLTLRLPIKDRVAASNLSDAVVQKRLDVLRRRSTEENVRLQVLTAISQMESSRESIRIATIARDLAQKRVEADQKRYELGTTTLFFVLASQTDYILAESNLVNQNITYRRNLLNLYQRTGQLLDERGIVAQ